MGYDPRSAAVIVLCIGVVLVAAVLFPVAGMDGGPTSGDADADVSEGPASDGSSTDDGSGSGETNDEPGDNADTGSDGEESGSETGGSDEQGAEREAGTDDETPAESPASSDGTDDLTVLVLGAILLVGAAYAVQTRTSIDLSRRSGRASLPLPDGPLPSLLNRLGRIPQLTMIATIALARRTTAVGSGLTALGRSVATAGASAGRGIQLTLSSVARLSIGLPSIPRPRFPSIGWSRSNDGGADDGQRVGSASSSDREPVVTEGGGYTEPDTVEEAWRRLVSSLSLRRPSVRTPRECAAIAVDAGLPREAVETMTGAFEAVRYGDAARTPARLERVRAAYERVRDSGGDGQ